MPYKKLQDALPDFVDYDKLLEAYKSELLIRVEQQGLELTELEIYKYARGVAGSCAINGKKIYLPEVGKPEEIEFKVSSFICQALGF